MLWRCLKIGVDVADQPCMDTHDKILRTLFAFGVLVELSSVTGCDANTKPPEPPVIEKKAETEQTAAQATSEPSLSPAASAETPLTRTNDFNKGGADISTDEDKANVKKCLGQNNFFDRFANPDGTGVCTTNALAKMDCTLDGVRSVLSEKHKIQFDANMSGTYAGWLLDQCLDCSPQNSIEQCKRNGETLTGTRLFFVKFDGQSLKGLPMLIPERPGQATL